MVGGEKSWCRVLAVGVLGTAMLLPLATYGQDALTVGTRNEFDFDFDGPTLETERGLGVTNISATISGVDLPSGLQTLDVLSVTLGVTATGGDVSADGGAGLEARGIGVSGSGDNTNADRSNLDAGESLLLALSSTGSYDVMITGLALSGFRGATAEITISGATVGGQTVLNTTNTSADFDALFFDSAVSEVTVFSSGADGFRIQGVYVNEVPEPTSAAAFTAMGLLLMRRRR